MGNTWGRECKLGWKYNWDFGLLIPVQGKPLMVTSEINNRWEYYRPFSLSSTDIHFKVNFLFTH